MYSCSHHNCCHGHGCDLNHLATPVVSLGWFLCSRFPPGVWGGVPTTIMVIITFLVMAVKTESLLNVLNPQQQQLVPETRGVGSLVAFVVRLGLFGLSQLLCVAVALEDEPEPG